MPQWALQPEQRSRRPCLECKADHGGKLTNEGFESALAETATARLLFPSRPVPGRRRSVPEADMPRLHPITTSSKAALIGCLETGASTFTPGGAFARV